MDSIPHASTGAAGADETAQSPGHYYYTGVPPIERLLLAIGAHCGVGGTIRPRNRQLADWANYASAGHISPLLDQLACDGWILYDRNTGLITLLFDPGVGSSDPDADQMIPDGIESVSNAESALIPSRDRVLQQQNGECESIPRRDQNAQCMEDSCLAAAEHDSESAAARYKLPCSAESIPTRDQNADLVMAELGTSAKLRARALATRPDLTAEQVLATRAYFAPRIAAGLCSEGAFHAALANGEIHAAPPERDRPIDVTAYASRDGFALGSQAPPGDDAHESIGDRAKRLLPPDASGADWVFVQTRLAQNRSDAEALADLAARRTKR